MREHLRFSRAYGVAFGATLAAATIRVLLAGPLGVTAPFLPFAIAVTVAAWYGGAGPGIAATFLSAAAALYLFVEPYFSLRIVRPGDAIVVTFFLSAGILISLLFEALRRARSAAQDREEELRVTLHSIGDGVIGTDTNGLISFMNPVAEGLTGWSQHEAKGRPLAEVFRIIGEDTRQPVENPVEKVFREGVTVGLANHTVLLTKDGRERPIDDSAAPVRDNAGNLHGVVLVFHDVTEARQIERALRDSERRLQLAVGIAEMGLFEIDLASDAVTVNEPGRAIYGWPNTHTTFTQVQSHFHPDDRDEVMRQVGEALGPLGSGAFEVVHRIYRTNGELRWIRVRGRAIFEEHGETRQAVRCLGTYLDITERKRFEEALEEADRKKDLFLATLAHELRNPLAPVRTGLELMKVLGQDPASLEEIRSTMERQVQHMVRLIDDLMDVSRISRGQLELRRCTVNLADIIRDAVETVRSHIDRAKHKLSILLPNEPIYLDGDPTRLTQVLSNLLDNAAKYSSNSGTITVSAEREGNRVLLLVRDEGAGISPDMQNRVFDMFVQAQRSSERGQGGLGIGLTLVKSVVELHGGTVRLKSEEGRGSEFSVRLPVSDHAPATNLHNDHPDGSAGSRRGRVLVVDDNQDAAVSLAMMLKVSGYETRTAHDGLEGLEVADQFRPDVILLDIGMPRLDGYGAARRIRESSWGKGVLLIALTGWGQEEDRERTREAGFDHHLVKPAEPALIHNLITRPAMPASVS